MRARATSTIAFAVVLAACACGGGGSHAPATAACNHQRGTTSSTTAAGGAIVISIEASGYCAGSPKIVVVPNPPPAGSLGHQMFSGRFAVVATSDPPAFSTTVTISATLTLEDGTPFAPAGNNFQILLRQ